MYRYVVFVFLLLTAYVASAQSSNEITLSFKDLPLDYVTKKTGYFFSYNSDIIPEGSLYSLSREKVPLKDFLKELLTGTNINFVFYEDQIILKKDSRLSEFKKGDTFTIKGWVRDRDSKRPIESVNIYLNETTIGTSSMKDGNYQIDHVPIGSYTIVFSHVGYYPVTYDFTVDKTGKMVINSLMETNISLLDAVAVESSPLVTEEENEEMLKIFKRELLGTSSNATKCEILNEEVLSFSFNPLEQLMKAYASEPVRIENRALGYLINYEMEFFESSSETIRSLANIKFEELEPQDDKEQKKWTQNREKAYKGSFRHFMKSIIENDYYSEGFRVYRVENRYDIDEKNLTPVQRDRIVEETEDPLEFKVSFDDYLFVTYTRELESAAYINDVIEQMLKSKDISLDKYIYADEKRPEVQRSLVKIVKDEVIVDLNGHTLEPLSVSLSGYWAWEKLADMVPLDFGVKKRNKN